MDKNLFLFTGHGVSVPEKYQDDYGSKHEHMFTLKPNQYVIMNKNVCPTFALGWTQEILWKIAQQSKPYDFIELLCKIHHTHKDKDESLSNYFGYFGSPDSEVICPNIILSAEEDEPSTNPFTQRFGLFKCPIYIIPEYTKEIIENNKLLNRKTVSEKQILQLIPRSGFLKSHSDDKFLNMQMKLIKPTQMWSSTVKTTIYFPLYRETLEYYYGSIFTLHDFVTLMGDKPFIIFCFVCRNTFQHAVRYHYIEENKLYPKELKELKEIMEHLDPEIFNSEHKPYKPYNPSAPEFKPATGGTMNLNYKIKYLKYKQKYLALKRNIMS